MRWRRKITFILFVAVSLTVIHRKFNQEVLYHYTNVNTNGFCVLPKFQPFDPSIVRFVYKSPPIFCDHSLSLVYINSSGILQINKTAVQISGYTSVRCTYCIVHRVGDDDISFGPEVTLLNPTYIAADFFHVKCRSDDKIVYDFMHHSIDFKNAPRTKTLRKEADDRLSVYMFGLDSVSRLAAERKLQKTMSYLRNDLKGYVMKGYTKIEENTFPNMLAVLTGKKPYSSELPPYTEILDPYPFIWNNFTDNGYVTLLAEDSIDMPTFNYWKGFNIQPCDHYMRPYQQAINKLQPYKIEFDKFFMFLGDKNINVGETSPLCYGNTPKHQLVINYYKQFIQTYGRTLKFGLSWLTDLGHTFNNLIELADDDIVDFFKWMKESGKLSNAVLIFFSDHGSAMNDIRNTAVGRIENKMPVLSIVIPETLKERYPHIHKHLLVNTERLSTPYDLYKTLADVLHRKFQTLPLSGDRFPIKRGISFFDEIPKERSCSNAGIAGQYCPCHTEKTVSKEEPIVRDIAKFILNTINEYFLKVPKKCVYLKLAKIISASAIQSNFVRDSKSEDFSLKKFIFKDSTETKRQYQVVIETIPGHATFEATVEYRGQKSLHLMGDISRTNKYGNQSFCVEKRMQPYCFCTALLEHW